MLIDLPPKRLLIDPGFCVDIANILHQLDIDFTTQQITLAPWLMDWQGYPAIALPFPPEYLSPF